MFWRNVAWFFSVVFFIFTVLSAIISITGFLDLSVYDGAKVENLWIGPLATLGFLIAGLISNPGFRDYIKNKYGIFIPGWLIVVIILIAWFGIGGLL